jgi:kinesin family protein 5
MRVKRNRRYCSDSGSQCLSNTCDIVFVCRAKTIKNVVVVNEELTAEEWKRRYEREREKVLRLRAQLNAADAELNRWRKGGHLQTIRHITIIFKAKKCRTANG